MPVRSLSTVIKTLAVLDVAAGPSSRCDCGLLRDTGEARGAVYQRLVTLVDAGGSNLTPDGAYRLSLRFIAHANNALEQASLGTRFTDNFIDRR